MRSNEEILEIIRNAFKPLSCNAHPAPDGEGVELWVVDSVGREPVGDQRIGWLTCRSDFVFKIHLEHIRQVIEVQRIPLDPWTFPPTV